MKNINLNQYNLDHFLKDLDKLNIQLHEKQLCQFMVYYELLVEWNQVMNLTAITDFEEVCKKHFIDSLSLVKAFAGNEKSDFDINIITNVIDIGTGAGFPGIPLKIAFPNLKITLLDSLNKRVNFLQNVISELELTGIEAAHGRAEDFAKQENHREQYDLCVSRAVANLSTLSEYCLPYVKIGGRFISYKSEKLAEEKTKAEKAISVLGGKFENQIEFMIPNSDIHRSLLVIYKCSDTPSKYPRKAGLPEKKPLR